MDLSKWTDWIVETAHEGGERLGASFAKLLGKRAPGDQAAADAVKRIEDIFARHQAELVAALDAIPHVPAVLATMSVAAGRTVLDAGLAGALEGYQANN